MFMVLDWILIKQIYYIKDSKDSFQWFRQRFSPFRALCVCVCVGVCVCVCVCVCKGETCRLYLRSRARLSSSACLAFRGLSCGFSDTLHVVSILDIDFQSAIATWGRFCSPERLVNGSCRNYESLLAWG